MNTMTNAMTWDVIAKYEGSEIQAISATEAKEVNGGIWPAIAIGVVICFIPVNAH